MYSGGSIQVLWAQRSNLPIFWYIKEHCHDYYHLFFPRSGNAEFVVDGEPYMTEKNSCILFMPGVRHGLTENHDKNLLMYEIKFRINDPGITEHLNKDSFLLSGGEFAERCIAYIVNNWDQKDERTKDYVASMLNALLLYNCYCKEEFQWKDSRYIHTENFDPITRNIIGYIESNYKYNFKLEYIEKKFGYTKSYLCDVFKRNTGITIVDYLQFIRIRMSAECLSYTGMDIFTTARSIGYMNISYFSRRFNAMVGVSPARFRRIFHVDDDGNLGGVMSDEVFTSKVETIEEGLYNLRKFGEVAATIKDSGEDDE